MTLKRVSFICMVILMLLFITTAFSGCGNKSFDMQQLTEITVNGSDTKGTISVSFNGHSEITDFVKEQYGQEGMISAISQALSDLIYDVHYEFDTDKNGSLSNGDKIKITCTYNKDAADALKISFSNTEFEYTVNGLQEAEELDVFKDVKPEFTGVSPNGKVTFNTDNCDRIVRNRVTFSCSASDNLKNGEKIVLTAKFDESSMADEGYFISETEKEYTVEGLGEYVTSLKSADSAELISKMTDICKNKIEDDNVHSGKWKFDREISQTWHVASDYNAEIEYKNVSNFYVLKNSTGSENSFAVLYEVTVTCTVNEDSNISRVKKGDVIKGTEYVMVKCDNVFVLDGKTYVNGKNSANGWSSICELKEFNNIDDVKKFLSPTTDTKLEELEAPVTTAE